MTFQEYFAPRFGFGWLIAFAVFLVCIVLWFIGKGLSDGQILLLIGALALARLT